MVRGGNSSGAGTRNPVGWAPYPGPGAAVSLAERFVAEVRLPSRRHGARGFYREP
jgi:hypothetical protein